MTHLDDWRLEARLASSAADQQAELLTQAERVKWLLTRLEVAEAKVARCEALLTQTEADAHEHKHLARLSTRSVRDALRGDA